MKLKYWLVVYPFHLSPDNKVQPMPSSFPVDPGAGAKRVAFEVEVPDDLFGDVPVQAAVIAESTPRSDR